MKWLIGVKRLSMLHCITNDIDTDAMMLDVQCFMELNVYISENGTYLAGTF